MHPHVIFLRVDKKIQLHAVGCFGSENNEYSVTLTVEGRLLRKHVAAEKGKFLSKDMR